MLKELFPYPIVESIRSQPDYIDFEEILKREHQETRDIVWQSASLLKSVMEYHYISQMDSIHTLQEQNMELRNQILLLQNSIPEIFIVSFSLVALGFFSFGFLFTSANTLFLFGIFGALALIIPCIISLRMSYSKTKRG